MRKAMHEILDDFTNTLFNSGYSKFTITTKEKGVVIKAELLNGEDYLFQIIDYYNNSDVIKTIKTNDAFKSLQNIKSAFLNKSQYELENVIDLIKQGNLKIL